MKLHWALPVVVALLVGLAPTTSAHDGDDVQSPQASLLDDLTAIAKARGWTVDQAWEYYAREEAVGSVAQAIAEARPESFVGSALSLLPDGDPTLYVKGPADGWIRGLVAATGIDIRVVDSLPFSLRELEERNWMVNRALSAALSTDVSSGFEIITGRISATVSGGPQSLSAINTALSAIPSELSSSVEVNFRAGVDYEPQNGYGGMEFWSSSGLSCTTGWTVEFLVYIVEHALVTAGHCTSVIKIKHPINQVHFTGWLDDHQGQWGDFSIHDLTDGSAMTDDFYSSPTTVRDVNAIEAASAISYNESICVFGRKTNAANCTAIVQEPSWACGGINRMVLMDRPVTQGGDSGGPWYVGQRAYGVHGGLCQGLSIFSAADYLDEALGGWKVSIH